MPHHANILGFDDNLWLFVQGLDSDVSKRLICRVLDIVDSSMNTPEAWPHTEFDCMYLAKLVNEMANSRDTMLQLLDGDGAQDIPTRDATANKKMSRLSDAREHVAEIDSASTRGLVLYAIRTCIEMINRGEVLPVGTFDMFYFTTVCEMAFSDHLLLKLILLGEGSRLDWFEEE